MWHNTCILSRAYMWSPLFHTQQWSTRVQKHRHPFPATSQVLGPHENSFGSRFEWISPACLGIVYLWCPGLHPSGGTAPKETNTHDKQLAKSKENEFLTDNRNCVTDVSALLSCAAGRRAHSCKAVLRCQGQQLSPSELPQMFSSWGKELCSGKSRLNFPFQSWHVKIWISMLFYRKAINLLLF